jgi:hypothetical protein
MKPVARVVVVAAVLAVICSAAMAASSTTQVVTINVSNINEISVSAAVTLTIATATAGADPDSVTNNATTYSITTNGSGKKIAGKIDSAMPTGLTLSANLAAPTGGTSVGYVSLTATNQDLVTGITKVKGTPGITLKLDATPAADPTVTAITRTITYTIL